MTFPADKLWDPQNRNRVLIVSALLIAAIAIVDWGTAPYISLGFLYLFPLMLAAGFLPRPVLLVLGVICAILSETFSSLDPTWSGSRLALETLAFAGCALFASELLRNRRLTVERQQRLRALVETSPAGIVTIDESGAIEMANQAAAALLAPGGPNLLEQPIARFIPELLVALRPNGKAPFRASMQCQVHRSNGEPFLAEVWFSTYQEHGAAKLAAIIADVTDEQEASTSANRAESDGKERLGFNSRQVAVLRLVLEGMKNNEIASRLQITPSAVKNTLQQLFSKAGVGNRSQLVRAALERYRDLF